MKNYLLLVKTGILQALSGSPNKRKNGKQSKSRLTGLIMIAVAVLGVGIGYSIIFGNAFNASNAPEMLLSMMSMLAIILLFVFGLYDGISNLFGYKDYYVLSSMPIKRSTMILAKLTTTYIIDFALTVAILLPASIVYSTFVPQNAWFFISSVLTCLFLPALALSLTITIAVLIKLFVSRFKNSAQIETAITYIGYILIFGLSFYFGYFTEESVMPTIPAIFNVYQKILAYPLYLGAFVLIAVALFLIVCFIIAVNYVKLYSVITSVKKGKGYKIKEEKTRSPFMTIVKKEFKRIFSNANFALNSFFGAFMYLFAVFGISITFKVIGISVFLKDYALVFALPLTAFALLIASPTSASISVEGKSFYLLKTLPVSTEKILTAKLYAGTILPAIFGMVGSLGIGILFNIGILQTILLIIATVAMVVGGGAFGLVLNVRFYNLQWTNINQPIKQGLSVFLLLVSAIVFALLLGALAYVGYMFEIFLLSFIFQAVIVLALTFSALLVLYTVSVKRFSKIN